MSNKKKYTAPSAEIIILAAREPITTWKLPGNWWFTNDNHWGVNTLNEASAIGGQYNWFENITEDPEINDT